MNHILKRTVGALVGELRALGFGDEDADISGADTVDVVNRYFDDLEEQTGQPLCNSDFLADIMEFGDNAPVNQMLIMEAVRRYAEEVAKCQPKDLSGMLNGFISPAQWIAAGKEVSKKMEMRLGPPSKPR